MSIFNKTSEKGKALWESIEEDFLKSPIWVRERIMNAVIEKKDNKKYKIKITIEEEL